MYNYISIEWDEKKYKSNRDKHDLCFEDAVHVFQGETVTYVDDRYDYGEMRYITLGELNRRTVIIAHTYRQTRIRIISMRKANEREKKYYQKRLKEIRRNEG